MDSSSGRIPTAMAFLTLFCKRWMQRRARQRAEETFLAAISSARSRREPFMAQRRTPSLSIYLKDSVTLPVSSQSTTVSSILSGCQLANGTPRASIRLIFSLFCCKCIRSMQYSHIAPRTMPIPSRTPPHLFQDLTEQSRSRLSQNCAR